LNKDYEYCVQSSETLIEIAATRLMLNRLAQAWGFLNTLSKRPEPRRAVRVACTSQWLSGLISTAKPDAGSNRNVGCQRSWALSAKRGAARDIKIPRLLRTQRQPKDDDQSDRDQRFDQAIWGICQQTVRRWAIRLLYASVRKMISFELSASRFEINNFPRSYVVGDPAGTQERQDRAGNGPPGDVEATAIERRQVLIAIPGPRCDPFLSRADCMLWDRFSPFRSINGLSSSTIRRTSRHIQDTVRQIRARGMLRAGTSPSTPGLSP
jgi:hypothetical protein